MRTKLFLLSIVATLLLIPAGIFAQDARAEKHMKKRWAELGITSEQEAKLRELHTEAQKSRKAHMEKVKDLREKTRQELLKDNPSKSTLNDYAKQMGDLHKIMNENRIDHLLKMKAILTPEQFSKIASRGFMGGEGPKCGMRSHGMKMKGKMGGCPRDGGANHCPKADGALVE